MTFPMAAASFKHGIKTAMLGCEARLSGTESRDDTAFMASKPCGNVDKNAPPQTTTGSSWVM
jgi:hypothetical protein